MNRDKIELSIVVANTPIKEYGHKGDTYVEGRLDTEYVLRVRNHYGHRVLVVPSIDGLNPLNGETTVNNDEGYVVPAYGSITIDGWRTSLSQVSKFVFNKKTQSYSAKTGNGTANCGVIGIQVFGEKLPEIKYYPVYYPQPYYVYPTRWETYWNTPMCGGLTSSNVGICNFTMSSNNNDQQGALQSATQYSCSLNSLTTSDALQNNSASNSLRSCASSEVSEQDCYFSQVVADDTPHQLGTGWGEAKESVVSQTTFTKGDLLQTLEIFYANRTGLESLGIDLSKSNKVAFVKPQAFGGFCKAPRN